MNPRHPVNQGFQGSRTWMPKFIVRFLLPHWPQRLRDLMDDLEALEKYQFVDQVAAEQATSIREQMDEINPRWRFEYERASRKAGWIMPVVVVVGGLLFTVGLSYACGV